MHLTFRLVITYFPRCFDENQCQNCDPEATLLSGLQFQKQCSFAGMRECFFFLNPLSKTRAAMRIVANYTPVVFLGNHQHLQCMTTISFIFHSVKKYKATLKWNFGIPQTWVGNNVNKPGYVFFSPTCRFIVHVFAVYITHVRPRVIVLFFTWCSKVLCITKKTKPIVFGSTVDCSPTKRLKFSRLC